MVNLDNLGYNTYILGTIKSITECKRILVYNKNSFINYSNYSRLTLYNLNDIFDAVLFNGNCSNEHCLMLERSLDGTEDPSNIPFHYDCDNGRTNGFNIIIYVKDDDTPAGYTEFINTQGNISDSIDIYLKFTVEINKIEIGLTNSLYKIKGSLQKDFLGTELSDYTSSKVVISDINELPRCSKYTSHLSAFLSEHSKDNVFLGDRLLTKDGNDLVLSKLNLLVNADLLEGETYDHLQIGYYGDDIVLYSWINIQDSDPNNYSGIYYKIVSLINRNVYKHTRNDVDGMVDTIPNYFNEISKELLYAAGRYLVFKINYRRNSIIKLYNTEEDVWVDTKEDNVIVDPFDKRAIIYEIPKSTSIQSYDTALELIPELSNVYFDLKTFIYERRSLNIVRKIGDWFIFSSKDGNKTYYIATNMFNVIYMTEYDYNNMVVINDNALLIKEENYYVLYYGIRKKTYYTEKARSLKYNSTMENTELSSGTEIMISNDSEKNDYTNIYNSSEIAIIGKSKFIYNTILNSFRRQPLSDIIVPGNIFGAIGGILYYTKNNVINYL